MLEALEVLRYELTQRPFCYAFSSDKERCDKRLRHISFIKRLLGACPAID